ncbi:MAG: ATP-dependent RNA helicase [Berkelbacteria bacterium GW2011_GWA2_46_7]|uniref:ATP-dependent RNA helicase n=1 Tax=Berkelbacteria bacterium GW2011_GWA2_46_7 TaxID=1618335 RepID=A0A0G1SPY4_9BACT|nr:MAG: ATP-dependent RNA helicase [Berkelbacteria bacterium GW2011_GWA2_46_7]
MYNNTRTSRRPSLGRSRTHRFGRRNSNPGTSGVHPSRYINKSVDLPIELPYAPTHSFDDFGLSNQIVERVIRRGYTTPTPIQDQAIPIVMAGDDVIGLADTGTGKTAVFLLPLIHRMLADRSQKALIIVPTRELAVQIDEELKEFAYGLPIYSAVCIGGNGYGHQDRSLQRRPQFVIGTPGRLKDHFERRTLHLSDVQNLVIDEADRLVDMGFIKDIRMLVGKLPLNRQTLFFSATMAPEVKDMVHSFLQSPQTISVKKRETSVNVDQDVIHFTDNFHKMTLLRELLGRDECKKVLIFGKTKHGVERLCDALIERGFSATSIHGNKSQSQRQRSLNEFKDNKTQILVATDVAARGLDIPNVTHVINFDLPQSYGDYIHRIGRTGRADQKGKALTFVQ